MNSLLLLCLVCQDPAPQAAPRAPQTRHAQALDVVELVNGDVIEGRITAEHAGYVEIQLEPGASVGVSRAQVAAIRRGAGPVTPDVDARIPASNEWFVLHDARGTAVGWLHTSVQPRLDGGLTVSEEYEFVEGQRRYQVTSMCTADAGMTPVSSYFRERVADPLLPIVTLLGPTGGQPDRIVEERIVEAQCRGDRLHVLRLDRSGRQERQLDWTPQDTFPLLARTLAKHGVGPDATATVFDPAIEELTAHRFDGARQRRVTLDGKAVQVTEIAATTSAGRNSEWLDASLRTVRRELAGPSLVAVLSSAETARLAVGETTIPSAIVADAGGELGVWVPNPAWQAQEGLPAGQVVLTCEPHGASIALTRLDHLEAGASLDAAADAVENWFLLLHPTLRLEGRETTAVRDRKAVQLHAVSAGRAAQRATIDVIPHQGRFLVFVCMAPASAWDELADDFAFSRRTLELSAQALSPKLQGPLARGKSESPSPKTTAKAGSGTAPTRSKAKDGPIVRIPKDG